MKFLCPPENILKTVILVKIHVRHRTHFVLCREVVIHDAASVQRLLSARRVDPSSGPVSSLKACRVGVIIEMGDGHSFNNQSPPHAKGPKTTWQLR